MPNPLLQTISYVRRPWREGLWQITLEQGIIRRLAPQNHGQRDGEGVLNAEGELAILPFVEPHIHLDTTQIAGDPRWNESGTLFERIARWAKRKAELTHEDVKIRAWQTLKWQIANGIQHVRSHVDVSDPVAEGVKSAVGVKVIGKIRVNVAFDYGDTVALRQRQQRHLVGVRHQIAQ